MTFLTRIENHGGETSFHLTKTYVSGNHSYVQEIRKPVASSLHVALDGVEQMSDWSVDTTTGVFTFTTQPGAGVVVAAGFEFDVPASATVMRARVRDDWRSSDRRTPKSRLTSCPDNVEASVGIGATVWVELFG
jgi:uncharacterized protein (TIGR02217 family)